MPLPRTRAKVPPAPRKKNAKITKLPRASKAMVQAPIGTPAKATGKAAADPRFKKVMTLIDTSAAKVKSHPSPAQKASEAQAASQSPPKEQLAGAQANQVDTMKEAKGEKPDSGSFLSMLRAEIEKVMPKNLDESDKFMEGGAKDQMKGAVSGNVGEQRDAAAGPLQTTTAQPPDPSTVPARQSESIPGEPAPAPLSVNTAEAMPAPKPAAEVNKPGEDAKKNADKQMQEAELKPEQLQKANDSRFSAVIAKKGAVEATAAAGPAQFKSNEQKVLGVAATAANADGKASVMGFATVKRGSGAKVMSRQQAAKMKDEARRAEVVANIEKIFARTKAAVEAKLSSLDSEVSSLFDRGIDAALNTMKTTSEQQIDKFKDERYSGITGAGRWIADQFRETPPEIKRILERTRGVFTQQMDAMIVQIANLVERRLAEAKAEIDRGQAAVKSYVASLPADLQAVGKQAQSEVAGRFDELRKGVDDKKQELASKLADRYKKASEDADAALKKIEDANKGALSGLVAAIGEVLKVLTEFKDKLMSILRKGQETIKLIVADPIGFLKNLLAAIKGGFMQFIDNIGTHLKNAFMKWLFGSLADAGIELPKDLSLPSILKLVLGVLGITYDRMRAKAVKLIGERNVKIIEKLVEYVKELITGGPAALWEKIKEDLSDLKQAVIDAIQNWLITTLIKKAVTKIVSMFNPVGAIIQAIMTIYDVVIFVVEKAKQIMAFIEAVVNSVHAIATGAIGGAISWIEKSLANILPLLIGFLAQLIGLGGISAKIKEFIKKIQDRVDKAIDKVIAKIVNAVKKLFGGGKGGKEETPASANVKAKVGAELRGKQVKEHADEKQLIDSIYNKYQPQGLKSIRFAPNRQNPSKMDVIVSASLAEQVAQLNVATPEGVKELYQIASKMSLYAKTTTIYVYYDTDHKRFAIVSQKKSVSGHAERILRLKFPELLARIKRDRKRNKLLTPANQPVPIHLDITRTPCDNCADKGSHIHEIINMAAGDKANPVHVTTNSATVSTKTSPTTEAGIQRLLGFGVELTASKVWTEIKKQMEANGIKQLEIPSKTKVFTMSEVDQYIAEADDVNKLISKAVASLKKKPNEQKKG